MSSSNFILMPILVQMITALLLIFFWQKIKIQRIISTLGNMICLLCAFLLFQHVWSNGFVTLHTGNWKPPFGITFICDTLSATIVLVTSLVGFAVGIFSTVGISVNRIQYGYFPIFHFLLMGLMGAFLTGDLFNLYVWFEIVIISSFVLLTLGGKKMQLEGAIKYVAMNMLASTIFLTAIGILYGLTGSLNMADLSVKIAQIPNRGIVNVTALLFFIAFGIKSAVFPLYFWLPSSYHTPPSSIAAIFGGLLTKMGIYALIRFFTLLFVPDSFTVTLFVIVAIMTLFTGAFGAMNKTSIRKLLSYLIVCHIGYLIAGLGLYTQLAIAGALYYLFHDMVAKSNVFLISGLIYKIRSSTDLRRLGGLYKDYPKLSLLMIITLLAIAGIPPLSGFWPKINLMSEALRTGNYALLIGIIFASFVTLALIAKIWAEVFWKPIAKPNAELDDTFEPLSLPKKIALVLPICILTVATLYMSFFPENMFELTNRIANELMDPSAYINAVFQDTKLD